MSKLRQRDERLIIVTQSAEFNGKVSIVPMKQAGAGTLDISKEIGRAHV